MAKKTKSNRKSVEDGRSDPNSLLHGYMTVYEMAKELNVSVRTIFRYIDRGNMPVTRLGGRMYLKRDSVIKWLQSRETTPNPTRRRS